MPRRISQIVLASFFVAISANQLAAQSALTALSRDYTFPHKIDGLPSKLSDFTDLQVKTFETSDGVKLSYWEAGRGKPLIFVPGWSANGAQYINVMYLLREHYHVYVLDPRNQRLSERVEYGNRIARFAADLKEFTDHLGLRSADFCGHSMGSAILWSFIDQYGTGRIEKAIFVDQPISITARPEWSAKERLDYGAMVSNPEELVKMMSQFLAPSSDPSNRADKPKFSLLGKSTLAFENSESFANSVVKNDPTFMLKVLYDHAANDWHDVIREKIHLPVAIFSGDLSPNLPSQRWEHSAIIGSTLYVYSGAEEGDHLLMFRNPIKFANDVRAFLEGNDSSQSHVSNVSQEDAAVMRKEILRTNAAWNGVPYEIYPGGMAEPVVAEITIPAHGELPWHSHSMPSFAYVLSGEITVEDKQGNKKHFTKGQVMPETVNAAHRGIVGDQPATFIVFYARTKGMPLSGPVQ